MKNVYRFNIKGIMPLIMNHDSIEGQDAVAGWISKHSGESKPGDDRTPTWKWQTVLYTDGIQIALPNEMFMSALFSAGEKTRIDDTKVKNLKELSQTGLLIHEEHCPLLVGGKAITMRAIEALRDKSFADQCAGARKLGFQLWMKKVAMKNGQKITKQVRVRPRFDEWATTGTIEIIDDQLTEPKLKEMLTKMGRYIGFCDWRPGVKYPKRTGPFGKFTASLQRI